MSNEKTFGIVFKQRYKSANIKSTPVLNAKHLIYISTREGAVYNKECGFGLFGKIDGMENADNINNLERAKNEIYEISKRRTVYRAVFSLPHKDALEKGFYWREKWQKLMTEKIKFLAKEMEIEDKNFRWAASFHCEKGHPHVHVMHWDSGNSVRQEYIPPERFEILAEKIRAEFNREIYREELSKERFEKSNSEDEMLTELRAIFVEMNVAEPLMIRRITKEQQEKIYGELNKFLREMPASGLFRYKYLKPQAKSAADRFTNMLFEIPQFAAEKEKYLKSAEKISRIYGNSEKTVKRNAEKAQQKLYNQLGNVLLKYIKENGLKYAPTAEDLGAEYNGFMNELRREINENARSYELYRKLREMFPKHRTPLKEFADDEFRKSLCGLVKEILKSEKLCEKINHLIDNSVKFGLNELEIEQFADGSFSWAERKKYAKDFNKEEYKKVWREAYKLLFARLYEESGYKEQYRQSAALNALMNLFGALSQNANYQKNLHKDLNRRRGKGELSKEARKDKRKQLENAGDWELEI